ncbi:hypothetical protein V8E36_000802 [Tilletia maclaganii]
MSDWDADSADEKPTTAAAAPKAAYTPAPTNAFRRNFDDEEEDDVKDDWDDDDEDEDAKKKAAAPASNAAPSRKRGTVKQKIAEREAEERRQAEQGDDSDEEAEDDDYDPTARRKQEREAQIRADVENAAALLGTSRIAADDALSKLRTANPATKEEWEAFATEVYNELLKRQSARPGFDKHFVPQITRLVYGTLRDVEIRKGSTKLRELAEEKTKAEKEAKKNPTGKKTKPKAVGTSSAKNVMDLKAYGDEALDDGDDLDFM